MASFLAAAVQNAPVVFDTAATLSKIGSLTADAAKTGATFVVFPEAFVSAYPKGLDFDARGGMRSGEGRDTFRRYFDSDRRAGPKYDLDVVGHYARPDIFQLHVNEKATSVVTE